MSVETLTISAIDGYPLIASRYTPSITPALSTERVVMLSSASGVRRGYYHDFAEFLAQAGYTVITYDYRGVGDSRPEDWQKTMVAKMSDWGRLDGAGVLAWINATYPHAARFYVGHSFGGVALGLLPLHTSLSAAVLIAPPNFYWRNDSLTLTWRLLAFANLYIPFSEWRWGYFSGKPKSLGDDLPRGVMAEWAQWVKSPRFVRAFVPEAEQFYDQIRFPIHVYSLADDKLATQDIVDSLLAFYSQAPLTRRHVERHEVGGQKIGHIGFFRPQFQMNLWADLLGWLNQQG